MSLCPRPRLSVRLRMPFIQFDTTTTISIVGEWPSVLRRPFSSKLRLRAETQGASYVTNFSTLCFILLILNLVALFYARNFTNRKNTDVIQTKKVYKKHADKEPRVQDTKSYNSYSHVTPFHKEARTNFDSTTVFRSNYSFVKGFSHGILTTSNTDFAVVPKGLFRLTAVFSTSSDWFYMENPVP